MHDLKMTDQVAWHENDGPSMQDMKTQDLKSKTWKWRTILQDFVFSVTAKFFKVKS